MTTTNHEHLGSIPTEFYKGERPTVYIVGDFIAQLLRLPWQMPVGDKVGYEIHVVNIESNAPFVSLVKPSSSFTGPKNLGLIPAEFYKGERPTVYIVGDLIAQLLRLPWQIPIEDGVGYEIHVVNIESDTPSVSLVTKSVW